MAKPIADTRGSTADGFRAKRALNPSYGPPGHAACLTRNKRMDGIPHARTLDANAALR
jgi:hypothetical protein